MAVYSNIAQLIGKTPLLKLQRYGKKHKLNADVYAKLECFNPASSAKDRAVKKMIEDAEKSGKLKPGATIIEPTSGNTGIALCAVAVPMGYKVIIVMPDNMSAERCRIMAQFGARLVLTDGKLGMKSSIDKANELAKETENSFILSQFTNKSNADAHQITTGPEIFNDLNGKVDVFVAGIGTGGTITGVAKYLKNQNKNIQIVGVEPFDSPFLTKGKSGPHGLQGIGAGFAPDILDMSVVDKVVTVKTEQAIKEAKMLAQSEGVLAGISSGAALYAAKLIARKPENAGKNVVVLLPDTGERYISTQLFD